MNPYSEAPKIDQILNRLRLVEERVEENEGSTRNLLGLFQNANRQKSTHRTPPTSTPRYIGGNSVPGSGGPSVVSDTYKVKVRDLDATPNYLADKLTVSSPLTKTINTSIGGTDTIDFGFITGTSGQTLRYNSSNTLVADSYVKNMGSMAAGGLIIGNPVTPETDVPFQVWGQTSVATHADLIHVETDSDDNPVSIALNIPSYDAQFWLTGNDGGFTANSGIGHLGIRGTNPNGRMWFSLGSGAGGTFKDIMVLDQTGVVISQGGETGLGALTVIPKDSTQVGATIKGKASQSANLLDFRNSSNTLLSSLTKDGWLGIGVAPSGPIDVRNTFTSATGAGQALGFALATYNVADTGLKQGLVVVSAAGNTSGTMSSIIGLLGIGRGSGNGGTTTEVDSYWARLDSLTGHTVTTGRAIHIVDGSGAGTITNQYGLYIDALTKGSTLNYSIYTAGTTPSRFGGSVSIATAGEGLKIKEGTNARMGVATLVAGTVTVSNTSVTASTRIFLTNNSPSGTVGHLRISARAAGTSFTITSSSATDTSTVAWLLIEPEP